MMYTGVKMWCTPKLFLPVCYPEDSRQKGVRACANLQLCTRKQHMACCAKNIVPTERFCCNKESVRALYCMT
eukprot:6843333-Karenia_brevis.AAC.1